jgi:pyridoxamine 5'-phosphate oxidase family protein
MGEDVVAGRPLATWQSSCHHNRRQAMTELTKAQIDYLATQLLGRVATTGADAKPHVVPTSFRYNPELGAIDIGGHRVATTKKYRDVHANPWAAIVVDDLVSTDPWTPRMLEIRGRAEAVPTGGAGLGPGFGDAFIRLHPEKVNSFGIE